MVDVPKSTREDFELERQSPSERELPRARIKSCLVTWLDLDRLRLQDRLSGEVRG